MKAIVVGLAACVLALPIALAVASAAGAQSGSEPPCVSSGPVVALSAVQARNARLVTAVAQAALIDAGQDSSAQARGELIALMTAGVESGLHNWANPKVPGSESLPNDGLPADGGDHDSVGLFQQRASWGSLSVRMDPAGATRLLIDRVVGVPAWQTTPPGIVAQAVQNSAYPTRYAALEPLAAGWLAAIAATAVPCGGDGLPTGSGGSIPPGTIPVGYSIPTSATNPERRAITFALAQLGKPYVFGAVGPDAYDCSGLTMASWAAAGVSLPHYTVTQFEAGTAVAAISLASPGDLIFIPGEDGSLVPPNPQHVGMYIGDGFVVEAPQAGDVVKIFPVIAFGPVVGIRHYG